MQIRQVAAEKTYSEELNQLVQQFRGAAGGANNRNTLAKRQQQAQSSGSNFVAGVNAGG
jgi:hypothetical protein